MLFALVAICLGATGTLYSLLRAFEAVRIGAHVGASLCFWDLDRRISATVAVSDCDHRLAA